MQRRSGRILEWVTYGVADNGGSVGRILGFGPVRCGEVFATMGAGFNVFFGIIPSAAGVVEKEGEQDAGDGPDHEERSNTLRAEKRRANPNMKID